MRSVYMFICGGVLGTLWGSYDEYGNIKISPVIDTYTAEQQMIIEQINEVRRDRERMREEQNKSFYYWLFPNQKLPPLTPLPDYITKPKELK